MCEIKQTETPQIIGYCTRNTHFYARKRRDIERNKIKFLLRLRTFVLKGEGLR